MMGVRTGATSRKEICTDTGSTNTMTGQPIKASLPTILSKASASIPGQAGGSTEVIGWMGR